MKIRIAVLLLFALGIRVSYSQKMVFDNLDVSAGLPASECYHLHQDKKGYIWVFTEFGIVKHNGRKFVSVCKNLPLEKSAVYAVTENSNGEMFIVNSKSEIYQIINDFAHKIYGLSCLTKQLNRSQSYVEGVFFDDLGTFYLSASTTVHKFNKSQYWLKGKKNKVKKFKRSNSVLNFPFITQKRDAINRNFSRTAYDCHLYLVSNKGIRRKNKAHASSFPVRYKHKINRFAEYFSLRDSVFMVDQNNKLKSIPVGFEVLDLELSKNGHVWVGLNNGGLLEFDKNLKLLNHYFGKAIVSDILFADQNGLWVTTIGDGVYHCKNINRISYKDYPGLRRGITLIKTIQNKLFIGTVEGSLFVFEKSNLKKIDLGERNLLAITDIEYVSNKFFVSTKAKLVILDRNLQFEKCSKSQLCPNAIVQSGPSSFLISNDLNLLEYNTRTDDTLILAKTGRTKCLVRRNKEFFAVENEKLFRFKNGSVSYPDFSSVLRDKRISRLRVDKKNNLWICTKGFGIYCLDDNDKLTHLEKLPSKIVNDISFLKNGITVLSTNLGGYITRGKLGRTITWQKVISGEVITVEEAKSHVYFGTKKGLIVSPVSRLIENNQIRFYLSELIVGGKKQVPSRRVSTDFSNNHIVMSYDFLDYHLSGAALKYELKGPVKLSGLVSNYEFQLQNLVPGDYQLTVYPDYDFGEQKPPVITIALVVKPAFWQTLWFQILCIFVIVSFLGGIVFYFTQRKNRKRRTKIEIENLLTEHRLTALKAQVNPHFMSNSLVAIQRLIMEGNTENASLYLAKFSLLLRMLLEYSSRNAASVKEEIEMLELYVELEQLRFSQEFSFKLVIDDSIDVRDTYIPALITQPFVENAIWHGLLPLNGQRFPELQLVFRMAGNNLVIIIQDNGVGRLTGIEQSSRKSRGSSLMFERIENMNKLYQTSEGKIEYEDLFNKDSQPIGTRVNILIPEVILNELFDERD